VLTAIGAITKVKATRFETNIVQTAGTTAGQNGFMCVVLAAMDMLAAKPELGFHVHLTTWNIFWWLTFAGMVGVLLAVPLRKHYIDEENLPFAEGAAAGETLLVLDADPNAARSRVRSLSLGFFVSGALAFLRDGPWRLFPGEIGFGAHGAKLRMGSEISLLSFGSGMIVGLRVTLSMGLGMLLSWVIAPPLLTAHGIVPEQTFKDVLRWVMWPATGMMVAGGLMALLLKWKVIARTFRSLDMSGGDESQDLSLKWVVAGVVVFSIALAIQQKLSLGFPIWLSAITLLLSLLLMLVGTRVFGETSWAPISALANLMQAVFAALSPGNMAVNMIGSGMSGTIAANGEYVMQTYRTGQIVGSTNRNLTIMQLISVPIGSMAVAIAYPALKARYGIGENGLTSPISVKWAGFAELLSQGFDKLPHGCFTALLVALVIGGTLTLLEPKYHRFVPSPTGVGIGMLVPGYAIMPMVMGGIVSAIWAKRAPKSEAEHNLPLASGLIAGEALVVLVLAIVAIFNSR
jgi:putative OPT family oligopeptide transporter